MARPVKYTPEIIEDMIENMKRYIENEDIPIVAEFAYKNDIPKRTLYDLANKNKELLHSINKLVEKKEAQLEKLCLLGKIDRTMAVFSLKQLGWRDKQELEHSGTMGVTIVDDIKNK